MGNDLYINGTKITPGETICNRPGCEKPMPTIRTCEFPLWKAGVCSFECLRLEKEAQRLRAEVRGLRWTK